MYSQYRQLSGKFAIFISTSKEKDKSRAQTWGFQEDKGIIQRRNSCLVIHAIRCKTPSKQVDQRLNIGRVSCHQNVCAGNPKGGSQYIGV